MTDVVIVQARRTPIGTFLGAFRDTPAVTLGVQAARATLEGLPTGDLQDVIIGNVLQAGQGMNVARQVAVHAGLPHRVPAQTVNRVCGSGLQAIITAVHGIRCGDGQAYLAGGIENMSLAPHVMPALRQGVRLGHAEVRDTVLVDGLTDAFHHVHMGITAEHLARERGITRQDQDLFAAESHRRATEAREQGHFQAETLPVEVKGPRGQVLQVEHDEHIRPGTTPETLARLKPAFLPEGTVTAGNASGLNDGAALLYLASREYAEAQGLPILAEVVSYAAVGVDPMQMGIGPARAVPLALQKAGLSQQDISLFELNEAFAAQSLAVMQELALDDRQVNVTGGAIALGHPIGASGARVLVTLTHALRRTGGEFGVASLCIGGGMGIAVVVKAHH
ncbi:acetyl-CoA C-acetyltransferase [Deinococcus roseus]|uniref:Acetyl-CoA acetyltransferase n=1 Tax=Deinococcus roseus TaxID=392414 RepID=A0ABQ2DJ69_9DEIO|nr:acetyl-CoA C-acetyltransferase [Deinococcus roseus]GGJ58453.1 acetyl-CoA acetyltransferase [Deinococcus roseus]